MKLVRPKRIKPRLRTVLIIHYFVLRTFVFSSIEFLTPTSYQQQNTEIVRVYCVKLFQTFSFFLNHRTADRFINVSFLNYNWYLTDYLFDDSFNTEQQQNVWDLLYNCYWTDVRTKDGKKHIVWWCLPIYVRKHNLGH